MPGGDLTLGKLMWLTIASMALVHVFLPVGDTWHCHEQNQTLQMATSCLIGSQLKLLRF